MAKRSLAFLAVPVVARQRAIDCRAFRESLVVLYDEDEDEEADGDVDDWQIPAGCSADIFA